MWLLYRSVKACYNSIMAKKTILLIESDPKAVATVTGALAADYNLTVVGGEVEAVDFLNNKTPQLILIDFDLKPRDGLQIFSDLKTSVKTVMFSASNNIPLAVLASKAGVAAFLRKPLNTEELKKVVEQNISGEEGKLCWPKELDFLQGESSELTKLFPRLLEAIKSNKDIILLAEVGVPKIGLVDFVHLNSARKKRQLMSLDLKDFAKEDLEAYFWSSLTEMMSLPGANSIQADESRCGTLYLENIEALDAHFIKTIIGFIKQRRPKIDKSIQVVIGINDERLLQKIDLKDCCVIKIPPLRERKEDLPCLLDLYLKGASAQYNKVVDAIAADALKFLLAYDYPGNYQELESLVQAAVLAASANVLQKKDFPFDFNALVKVVTKKSLRRGLSLAPAKQQFEKGLYELLLAKLNQDQTAVASFLDIPKTTLLERLEHLMD